MNSLRTRLFIWIGSCLLCMFAISGLLLYVYVDRELEDHFDEVLLERANILARTTEQLAGGTLEFEFLEADLPQHKRQENADHYQVWRKTGETIARSPSLESCDLPVEFPLPQTPLFKNFTLPDGRAGRLVVVSFLPHEEEAPPTETFIMALGISREGLDQTLEDVFQGLCLAALALVLGTFPGVWISVRRALESLDLLAWQTNTIEANNLSFRFPTEDIPLELYPISSKLNNLLERLESAFGRERRFTSDAAHELRTPIAELKTLAEVCLEEADEKSPDMRPYFEDVLSIVNHMESLVTLLLALSRCESGQQKVNKTSIDLGRMVQEVWEGYEQNAKEHDRHVNVNVPEGLFIETDVDLLQAILANIFSNAVTYTPAEGSIQIDLQSRNDGFDLTVANTNTDLGESDIGHIFEPFWRKSPERSNTAHCGIGLSLVAAYARILDIRVKVSIPETKNLQVSLNFPVKAQNSGRQ